MNFSKIICQNSVDAEWSEKKLKLGFQKPIFFFKARNFFPNFFNSNERSKNEIQDYNEKLVYSDVQFSTKSI